MNPSHNHNSKKIQSYATQTSKEPVPETAAYLCHRPQDPNLGHLRDAPELTEWRWGCEKPLDKEAEPQTAKSTNGMPHRALGHRPSTSSEWHLTHESRGAFMGTLQCMPLHRVVQGTVGQALGLETGNKDNISKCADLRDAELWGTKSLQH